jgi:hypothetical protein
MTMPKWTGSITHNVVGGIVTSAILFIAGTLWARLAPTWRVPSLYGLSFGVGGLLIFYLVASLRRMAPIVELTTPDNIEEKVRVWLDRTNLTMKKDPTPKTYFRYIVTTDAGRKIILGRVIDESPDYLQFRAEITTTEAEKTELREFGQNETTRLNLELQLELARAQIGYTGLNAIDGFAIHKKIPITHALTEDQVIRCVWEMEAVLNQIFAIGALAYHRHRSSLGRVNNAEGEAQLLRGETGAGAL